MVNETKLKYIANFYGKEKQVSQLDEEMAELTIALHELLRGKIADTHNLTEEIADVENVLSQIKILFRVNQLEVDLVKSAKINREIGRITKELGYGKV